MIKKVKYSSAAVIMSAFMLLSGSVGSFTCAAAPDVSYEFDHARTAVAQLEDLFTTIDIMDATAAGLSDEMEKGSVTSEQLVQMYIDRIRAYDKKKKLNSIISINPNALKKNIRKCTIYVKATSKANKNRRAGTKFAKIVVR